MMTEREVVEMLLEYQLPQVLKDGTTVLDIETAPVPYDFCSIVRLKLLDTSGKIYFIASDTYKLSCCKDVQDLQSMYDWAWRRTTS